MTLKKKCLAHLKYPVIEEDHDDAGDVERRQGRVDDKVEIIENTQRRVTRWRMVQPKDDR